MDAGQKRLSGSQDHDISPLLVNAKTASAMCCKSLRTWRAWDAAGWIPRPVRIGRSKLWRVDELQEWVEAACPRRAEWESRQ
jgi:predicted DNA-binding transcriptional regulator AlpA